MAAAAPEPDAAYAAAAPVRSTDSTPLGDLKKKKRRGSSGSVSAP